MDIEIIGYPIWISVLYEYLYFLIFKCKYIRFNRQLSFIQHIVQYMRIPTVKLIRSRIIIAEIWLHEV